MRLLSSALEATLGVASNRENRFVRLGKAGRNVWKGFKSSVRGVAMNPIDHPHGGGNGKKSKPCDPKNP
jgi:large subunit ribosomal protein L2